MNQRKINFDAELSDNQIIIKLTSVNDDRELEIEAASILFSSLEKVGIEFTRKNLEQNWHNES